MSSVEKSVDKKSAERTASEAQGEAGGEGEREDRAGLLGRMREAWRDSVGNYATDDGATKNLFARLVDFGTLSRDEAVKLVGETRSKIEQNRRELEARVDESIKKATARVHLPSPAELKELKDDVDALERRIAAIEARRRSTSAA